MKLRGTRWNEMVPIPTRRSTYISMNSKSQVSTTKVKGNMRVKELDSETSR